MSADNNITLVGNITRTPELTFLDGGLPVLKFSIAVNKRWQNRTTKEWEERVSYFNVVTRGETADNASGSLDKGNRVVVIGRMEQRSWETESGATRSTVEIVADDVAPSLRFATAQVTRVARPTAPPGPARFPSEHGRHTPPPRRTIAQEYDEEPF